MVISLGRARHFLDHYLRVYSYHCKYICAWDVLLHWACMRYLRVYYVEFIGWWDCMRVCDPQIYLVYVPSMRDGWLLPKDSKSLSPSITLVTADLIAFYVLSWVDRSSSDSFWSYLFFIFFIIHHTFIVLHSYLSSFHDWYSLHIISLCSLILTSIPFLYHRWFCWDLLCPTHAHIGYL